jgi:hypothetical protein
MKAYWGNGGIAPRILDLATRWRWVVGLTPQPLYPLDTRLGGPQSQSGRGGEKNSQFLPRLEPPITQHVAQRYTTELSRLERGLPYQTRFINIHTSFRSIGSLESRLLKKCWYPMGAMNFKNRLYGMLLYWRQASRRDLRFATASARALGAHHPVGTKSVFLRVKVVGVWSWKLSST